MERTREGYNVKEEIYPDFVRVTYCSKPIFNKINPNWNQYYVDFGDKVSKPKNMNNPSRDDNILRARRKVFDIALLNSFDYFFTFTLDKEKIDRYDVSVIKKRLIKYLNNMQQRHNFRCLLIPEFHKDGALHFHGLCSGDLKLVDSGKKTESGQIIYNVPQWRLGFSTAIELYGDYTVVCKYITKYISKDFKKIFGKFYYTCGDLVREPIKSYDNYPYFLVSDLPSFRCSEANLNFKYDVFKEKNFKLGFDEID